MNFFITGDVHGCYYTFKETLEKWNPETEIFIQVGDLVDRGLHSAKVIELAISLAKKYSNAIFLKGNHEALMIKHFLNGPHDKWFNHYGKVTLDSYPFPGRGIETDIPWLSNNPIFYESDFVFVSHAGLTETEHAHEEDHKESLLWNRKPLKHIGIVQVHGHTPHKKSGPEYTSDSNSWNVDSGACYGNGLSSLRMNFEGQVLEEIFIPTDPRDYQRE